MLTLTPAAAQAINHAAAQSGQDEFSLRIAARECDDGAIDYALGFDEERNQDMAYVERGVNLLIGAASRPLLEHITVDFVELEPGNFGFIFVGQQGGGCGSGSSCGSGGGCGSGGCGSRN